jgi:hypothetical protein
LQWIFSVKLEKDLLTQIDNEKYAPSDEVTLKIPMALPYGEMGSDLYFQKMNGEFNYHGDQYKLIKQKFQNDTLFLVCIKNTALKRVDAVIVDYANAANDSPTKSEQALNVLSKLFRDFQQPSTLMLRTCITRGEAQKYTAAFFAIVERATPVLSPPPKKVS